MKAEERVIGNIEAMLKLSPIACELLQKAVMEKDRSLLEEISRIERDGDDLRRETARIIYKGAFIPYLRSNILRLVEDVDDILNTVDKAGKYCRKINDLGFIRSSVEVGRLLEINVLLCKIMSKNFIEFFKDPEKLKEAAIVVRMLEKEADNMKHSALESLRSRDVEFWDGLFTFNFIESIEEISDVVEDTMDTLQVIVLGL
jgi:predicted phosphate transport protein (TIGR00153 family)